MKKRIIILTCLGMVLMASNNLLATGGGGGGGGGGGDGTSNQQSQKPFYQATADEEPMTEAEAKENFSVYKFITGGHCFIGSTMGNSWLDEIFGRIWNPKTKQ
jgi:hypothetical protein